MTINTAVDTLIAQQQLQTTNASWTNLLTVYCKGIGEPAVGIGDFSVVCLNPTTGACAAWRQPVTFQCADDEARMAGVSLPATLILAKDFALALADIRIVYDGPYMKLDVKGCSGTTLEWYGAHTAPVQEAVA